jgi:hypothetical protein
MGWPFRPLDTLAQRPDGHFRAHRCDEDALPPSKNESIEMPNIMKPKLRLIALTPLLLAACQTEPVVTTTSTEVRQEVVRTQGDRVIGREVIVTKAPPAVQVETPTTSPGSQYVWTRGYWRWSGSDYVWVPGNWAERPRVAAVWVDGQWQNRPGGWVWVPGHWQ